MKKFYKCFAAIVGLMMILVAAVGCNNGSGNQTGSTGDNSEFVSRAAYIQMIGSSFGYVNPIAESDFFDDVKSGDDLYDVVQACAEWEIIEAGGNFNPNEKATLGFALESAVKSIGLEYIPEAGNSTEDLANFFVNNIAQIDISNLDGGIDAGTAELIVSYARDYRDNLELPQVCEVQVNEGVKEAVGAEFAFDEFGNTGTFLSGAASKYNVGDVIYVEPTDESIARGIKISSIDGDKFSYTDAAEEDIFYDVKISGTYEGTIVDVQYPTYSNTFDQIVMADQPDTFYVECLPFEEYEYNNLVYYYGDDSAVFEQVGVTDAAKAVVSNAKVTSDKGKDHIIYTISWTEAGVPIEVKVGVENIQVKADYDHPWYNPLDVKKANAQVSFDTKVQCDFNASVSKSIPLGSVTVNCGSTPFNVNFDLTANIGAQGEITVTYKSHVVATANYAKGKGLSTDISAVNKQFDIHAQVTLTAEVTACADLRLLKWSLTNIEATTGLVGIVTYDQDLLDPNVPICLDIYLYVPLRWGINQRSCLLTKISDKLKYSQVVWDSETSKITKRWHFENGVEVPECTRGKEEVETPVTDPETGEPYDEYKIFDFEPLEYDMIKLSSYSMFLDADQSQKIEFENIPDGYTEADLVYTMVTPGICEIDSLANVIGKSGGTTIVIVSTNDGMYRIALKVTVSIDYNQNIEGGFQEL